MTYRPASAVRWITVHYTATVVGGPPISMATIDRWHREKGYREAGYHYLIRLDGSEETGREVLADGRFEQGAHSRGENDESIGVCYEGGLLPSNTEKGVDTRTPAQKAQLIARLKKLKALYPNAVIEGHRDMPGAATQCPGFDVSAWWAEVEAQAAIPPDVEPVYPVIRPHVWAVFFKSIFGGLFR